MPNDFTSQLIEEFRATNGRLSGPFDGARMLLLTTTGARSGKPHTTILGYYPDHGGRVLVVGSAAGGPKHPDWYHNLLANPRVTVDTGSFTYEAEAVVLRGAERDEIFARLVEADPGWAEYQAKTTRTLPVVALTQVTGGPPNAANFGEALRMIHDVFRRELTLIRKEVATAGRTLGAQLKINCLTLCHGLHYHHTGESTGLFPAVLEKHPELEPTITALQSEHDQIAVLLDDLQQLVNTEAPPTEVLPELDRLIADLNHHLDHEEARLIPLLQT